MITKFLYIWLNLFSWSVTTVECWHKHRFATDLPVLPQTQTCYNWMHCLYRLDSLYYIGHFACVDFAEFQFLHNPFNQTGLGFLGLTRHVWSRSQCVMVSLTSVNIVLDSHTYESIATVGVRLRWQEVTEIAFCAYWLRLLPVFGFCYFNVYKITISYIQGGPKNRTVFIPDNFVTVSPRKACSMSKFSQCYREKRSKTRISVSLNILCQICSNRHNSWNYGIYDQNTWILLNLH